MSTYGNSDAYAREYRREIVEMTRKKMAAESIQAPVRLEFGRLPTDDTYEGIVKRGESIWLVSPEPGTKRTGNVKVERQSDGAWTCICKGWQKNRGVDCKHVLRVRFMIGEGGAVPYDGRRRRLATKWLFPQGPSEDTRRDKARQMEPIQVPILAAQMCERFAPQPPRDQTRSAKGGANGAPRPSRVFALLMKVFWNCSYEQLRARLAEQGTMWELGLLKAEIPNKRAMVEWFGSPDLTEPLKRIFEQTTRPTRHFDSMIVGDSHDIPTRMVDNSRDRKFGPKPAKYRNAERPLIRQHFAVGKVSNIIYAAEITLAEGPGSADGPHLPSLLEQTKARTDAVKVAAFDKAYGGRANFAAAEELGIDLYVREKSGKEDRQRSDWPESAQRLSRLERSDPATYAETYRFRSKAEGTPSRIKARNPYVRLRRRTGDPVPSFPNDMEGGMSSLSSEVRTAIFDAATEAVGVARLNESLAILIVANLRALNVLQHLFDQEVTFEHDVTLNPPIEVSEHDVRAA